VAHGDGRRDMPARREDGGIPGRDLQHGADGFAPRVIEVATGNGDDFAVELVRPARVVLEHLGNTLHLGPTVPYRFAAGGSFELGHGLGTIPDALTDGVHDATTLGMAQGRP